ncbi:glyoxalase domain-containing protein 4 [Hermetia illucens]|nr:glyoxalase domain-containing protein 4 [Hermetia illucens]XP_037920776.1 glyoxalase domain-containing protein 4 [Hermetia illucens]XP_037920777.1 glyoxalase domain-containing protein 4 [Hermetia illucens]
MMSDFGIRALHYVFKIGDRAKNAFFYRNILGMQVLRHEEFTEGCDAQCNGPYDNRWSKTMVGYGPESTHFAIELTYNYGVTSYELGNDFGGITIRSKEIIERAKQHKYPFASSGSQFILTAPDGYKFYILDETQPIDSDPVYKVTLHSSNLGKSRSYWHDTLKMAILEETPHYLLMSYGEKQAKLEIREIAAPLNRGKAYGRIAFAVPYEIQPKIDELVKKIAGKILTPLISLDTPGKATVRVIILADPDDHEICFVDEEGFTLLSAVDPQGNELLDKYINKDPFQIK